MALQEAHPGRGPKPKHEGHVIDRRTFLTRVGRVGLGAGVVSIAGGTFAQACGIIERFSGNPGDSNGVPIDTQGPDNTATAPATATGTPKPIETAKPTDTPIQTETVASTDTPKPTDTPTPEPTTPEPTKTPEPIDPLNEEFVNKMYDVLQNIEWSRYKSAEGLITKENVLTATQVEDRFSIKDLVEQDQPAELLRLLLFIMSKTEMSDKGHFVLNPPPDLAVPPETEDHRRFREEIIVPLKDNLLKLYADNAEGRERVEKLLDQRGWEWVSERPEHPPYKDFVEKLSNLEPLFVMQFKLDLAAGRIVGGMGFYVDPICSRFDGSTYSIGWRDRFLIPYFQMIIETPDFTDFQKKSAAEYLRTCEATISK